MRGLGYLERLLSSLGAWAGEVVGVGLSVVVVVVSVLGVSVIVVAPLGGPGSRTLENLQDPIENLQDPIENLPEPFLFFFSPILSTPPASL